MGKKTSRPARADEIPSIAAHADRMGHEMTAQEVRDLLDGSSGWRSLSPILNVCQDLEKWPGVDELFRLVRMARR